MADQGSRAAGYLISLALLVLLVLLSGPFLGIIGWRGFAVAAGVTAGCAVVVWLARVRSA